ncbi:Alpha subunit [Aspergillus sclerotialis]|uniref:Protein farnesyltransferase/geranylgeranyltransferase type-1 subunit alpha n=1 Tax=Aspergillus sclerotialis TaxID=2070753 RepID=A0A3A2Z6I0_9EURO|nr:Alpha subunit [Aspergillus sclerotialis]
MEPEKKGKYASSPEWSNITPIPLNDGSDSGAQPLATIAYAPEYLEATSYLRAVMADNEMSERALALTEDIIKMNPAHYTVWNYRAKILFALEKDLLDELDWLNGVSLKYLKNYQIWYSPSIYTIPSTNGERHHRQVLISSRQHFPTLPTGEPAFLMSMFEQDSKNYHVWTYRHWLVRHFRLWDSPQELSDVESLLDSDVRNNSAWNHRFMLKFGPRDDEPAGLPNSTTLPPEQKGRLDVVDEEVVDAELDYAKGKIVLAPQNRSPWAYARGVLRAAGRGVGEWLSFVSQFVGAEAESVKSTHALEWLVDVYLEDSEHEKKEEAVRLLNLLKERYDPIRKNYWDYRIRMVEGVV